jgi:hypothetical protein
MELTLDQYTEELKKDLVRFTKYWREHQAKTPEHWPEKMGSADWHEQFIIFLSTVDHP